MALPGDGGTTPTVTGMFDSFAIGRATSVGIKNGFWTGGYGGVTGGAAQLTTAQLYDTAGVAVGTAQDTVRIAFPQITYVS